MRAGVADRWWPGCEGWCFVAVVVLAAAGVVQGQSSSLYGGGARVSRPAGAAQQEGEESDGVVRNRALEETSLIAVRLPPPRKFRVHDLVTVVVVEKKDFKSDAELRSEKDFEVDSELKAWARIINGKLQARPFVGGNPKIEYEYQQELQNRGRAKRKDQLTLRVAAEIVDIKPNGNLVLAGRRVIEHDDEQITITLGGTCRAEDVTPDLTIISTKVADFQIQISHTGAVRDGSRRGWVTRLLDLFRPI